MFRIPPLLRLSAANILLLLLLFITLRLLFWFWFRLSGSPLPLEMLLESLYVGSKFDLRLAALVVAPLPLLGWLPYLNPLRFRFGIWLWGAYFSLANAAVLLIYFLDFGHYSYLRIRIDNTVFRFAENPDISLQMVLQSYPIFWISVAYLILLSATLYGFVRLVHYSRGLNHKPLAWLKQGVQLFVLFFLYLFAIYGKVSWYPLRWNDAFYSANAFASAVALNPVIYLYDTYMNGGLAFDEEETRRYYSKMGSHLGIDDMDSQRLNFARAVKPQMDITGRPNVVIFLVESWASHKTSLSGNPLNPTPEFAKIAKEGIYFSNFFVPHTGTAHSVFALMTGSPDVQLGDTASRNPTIINQHLLFNSFQNYAKFYMLGGSASWRNIRALFSNNIPDIQIYEEGSYDAPRSDVWGISDLNLLKAANRVFSQQEDPFIAVVQTSGNHRPYTIPDDNDDFTNIEPKLEPARYGFDDSGEFNAYRLSDFNFGRFFALAKREAYFENTLFLFLGDHGIGGSSGEHTHPQETKLGLGSFRVPFVIYAPALIPGGEVIETVASELDVMTTVASLTGHNHLNTSLGRDLFNTNYDSSRVAFTISHSGVPTIGIIDKDYYFRMRSDGSDRHLFQLNNSDPLQNFLESERERSQAMEELTRGYYESARYIINHNRPSDHRQD